MKRNLSLVLVSAFLIISILHLLVYATVQQVHRLSADEAPRLLSSRLGELAASGRLRTDSLDAETRALIVTRGVYYVVVRGDGAITATNLPSSQGAVTAMPVGLLQQARRRGRHSITWAPQDVRYALALEPVRGTNLFVGGCGPLFATERQVLRLWCMVLLSWFGCSVSLAFAGAVLFQRFSSLPVAQAARSAA